VWKETQRALAEPSPRRFFEVLDRCGALEKLFPELAQLFGVPQPERFHPEIDTGEHVLMVLDAATRLSDDPRVRFAALVHDLGKGETPRHLWPRHIGLARLVAAHHGRFRRIGTELQPSEVVGTLEAVDAFRRPERFEQFLLACEADLRGRRGLAEHEYPQGAVFRRALQAASAVDVRPILERGFRGEALGDELRRQRVIAVEGAVGHGRKDGSVTHQQAAGNTDG
jgi:tRNA nucleotidyltransferase (CCA-adding enzyme)